MFGYIYISLVARKIKIATLEMSIGALMLYCSIPFLGEAWHYFNTPKLNVETWDVYYAFDFGAQPKWVVRDISVQAYLILTSAIALIWGWDKRARRIIGTAMLTWALGDTFAYFYNYQQWNGYIYVYIVTYVVEFIGWVLWFKYQDKHKDDGTNRIDSVNNLRRI